MPSPICTVDGYSTVDGVNVASGSTVTIQLSDLTGVTNWSIKCIDSDDQQSPATLTNSLSINNATRTATFTAPSSTRGTALIFQSKINNGKDLNGKNQASYTTNFGVFVVGSSGLRLLARNQTTQGDADFGWVTDINAILARGGATPLATDVVTGTIQLSGDLSGDSIAPVVVGIQDREVSDAAPDDGYVLAWNDALSQWEPQSVAAIGIADATTTSKGAVKLAGDLAGSGSSAATPRTSGINGTSIPAGGSLTTHHLLKVSGASAMNFGLITNDNIDDAAAIDGSKISPAFGSQNISNTGTLVSQGAFTLGGSNTTNAIRGSVAINPRTISTSTYTLDAAGTQDSLIFANSAAATITLTLPPPTSGRIIFIVDSGSNASSNPITIASNAGESINGSGANYTISTNNKQVRAISNGTDWWIS